MIPNFGKILISKFAPANTKKSKNNGESMVLRVSKNLNEYLWVLINIAPKNIDDKRTDKCSQMARPIFKKMNPNVKINNSVCVRIKR